MLALAFREKNSQTKPVLALSTNHKADVVEKVVRGKLKKKPELNFDYNSYMGSVDLSDKKVYHYVAERSNRRFLSQHHRQMCSKCMDFIQFEF